MKHRIARLEANRGIGPSADGACGYCRGRENELGKVVVMHDPPSYQPLCRLDSPRPQPGPTPCPRCGRDMNITILVRHVDLMAERRADVGLLPTLATRRPLAE